MNCNKCYDCNTYNYCIKCSSRVNCDNKENAYNYIEH